MTDLFDSEGNAVEGAFTKDEVEKKIDEALKTGKEETDTSIKDLTEKVGVLETDKKTLEDKLKGDDKGGEGKEKDKELNFEKVRTMLKTKDEEIGTLNTKITELSEGMDSKFNEKKIADSIALLSKGDSEVAKKIRFHFDNYKMKPEDETPGKTEEAFKKTLEFAYLLATGKTPKSALTSDIISSGGGYVPELPGEQSKVKLSEGAKEVGSKLGLTDKDMEEKS